ncbi:hypothetical protein Rhow_004756 [Rhodococcus wratislaviensis]|uniref:Uncharacterized protein n=1 Tax=Rhodococcus wratislaviensis TaxID=44752 RepID=A0A402CC85_RHOWR|nr:hypothetical protein Rhow_004756 [Rhodococcus wratislaviensis]
MRYVTRALGWGSCLFLTDTPTPEPGVRVPDRGARIEVLASR